MVDNFDTKLIERLEMFISLVRQNKVSREVKEDVNCYIVAVLQGKCDIDPKVLKFLFMGWYIYQNIENTFDNLNEDELESEVNKLIGINVIPDSSSETDEGS